MLERKGECLETAEWLHNKSEAITRRAHDKEIHSNEYLHGVLDIKTTLTCGLILIEQEVTKGFLKVEEIRARDWAEIRLTLNELAGNAVLQVFARERIDWTKHWQFLCSRPDNREVWDDCAKVALNRYRDFDLSLLGEKSAGPEGE